MRKILLAILFTATSLTPVQAAQQPLTAISRNLYLGADVGVAMELIPDFSAAAQFLAATRELGHEYVLASRDGVDALAVKKELASKIIRVGNSEYETSYSIIPKVMTLYRGYTWADIAYNGSKVRIVSTHLESLWESNKVPNAALQAKQLVDDLSAITMPTIVIGDFNSDPRDPRPNAKSNPGGQPESSKTCAPQVDKPTVNSAIDICNEYWVMRKAGFADAGPDAQDGRNFTWGMGALLEGPRETRYQAALKMGNKNGFTDRLDYIFLKNGAEATEVRIIGNSAPKSGLWRSDHAGIVAQISIPAYSDESTPLNPHNPFPISFWNWVGIALVISVGILITWRRRKNHG